ncbi:MBOAT, membrane-bound O-acyltransferase family-domain-containing protein [Scheffersomyces coipomensis]|uniref:MBOAT, membrane-bound O-acyltransferase family-domain-containing protein n=1 Tax=Scheffersomyces coipomensis TaxID=1788519 RepID=UPI00315CFAC3
MATIALNHFLSFFSLEALDGRLAPSENQLKRQAIIKKVGPQSRWSTLEFKFYGIVFAIVVPLMFKTAMDASNETNANYTRFAHLLSNGWLFGRKVDNSDQQYRFFRDNFLMLCGLIVAHCSLRRILTPLLGIPKRTYFDFVFGIVFIIGAHGTNSLRILIHVLIIYGLAKYIPSNKIAVIAVWVYGISTLFINDNFRTVKFGISAIDNGFSGIISRWDVFFNFTLLRMLSFSLDYLEKKRLKTPPNDKEILDLSYLDDRQRLEAPLPLGEYNFLNYIAYLTYTPLFIAGPIITFNDYIYQSNYQPLASVKNYKRTLIYFLRLLFCIFVMEFILHFMYVVAVSKTKAWYGDSPFQISMIGMFNLNIIWLKLLIPWRLFRFWSLLDGIDPPENMIRCMDNNFSALAFWRAWHRSYNKWIVRYIYVPLGGGGKYRIVNSLFVFSFVAIWHDIELKLLMWGWLVVVFLMPEILATMTFKRFEEEWWFRYLCGFGAVINIWMMMIANLFGFCLGKDGTLILLHDLFKTYSGIQFFILSSGALFVASQVMFELRESEKRRGIDVKC